MGISRKRGSGLSSQQRPDRIGMEADAVRRRCIPRELSATPSKLRSTCASRMRLARLLSRNSAQRLARQSSGEAPAYVCAAGLRSRRPQACCVAFGSASPRYGSRACRRLRSVAGRRYRAGPARDDRAPARRRLDSIASDDAQAQCGAEEWLAVHRAAHDLACPPWRRCTSALARRWSCASIFWLRYASSSRRRAASQRSFRAAFHRATRPADGTGLPRSSN